MSWEGARPHLILASSSPRRVELLGTVGVVPTVRPADVDEDPGPGEKPAELVERLALAKAQAVAHSTSDRDRSSSERGRATDDQPGDQIEPSEDVLVIGADTVIDLDGQVLGKPADEAHARQMLRALSGRSHVVYTGIAVVGRLAGQEVVAVTVERTDVSFRPLTEDDIGWYVASGEPDGKAGAYALQGRGSLLIEAIEGSHQTVVGLSLVGLDRLLTGLGHPLRSLAER